VGRPAKEWEIVSISEVPGSLPAAAEANKAKIRKALGADSVHRYVQYGAKEESRMKRPATGCDGRRLGQSGVISEVPVPDLESHYVTGYHELLTPRSGDSSILCPCFFNSRFYSFRETEMASIYYV
jgi:hypothetical protein